MKTQIYATPAVKGLKNHRPESVSPYRDPHIFQMRA